MSARPRTHGESAQRRRRALLDAAVELVGEKGAAAVTHRAVAERAGLPPSTTSYFFASIDELVSEALHVYTAERVAELNAVAAELPDEVTPDDVTRLAASMMVTDPPERSLSLIEAYLDAARTPARQPVVAEVLASYRNVAVTVLRAAGARRARAGARAFNALVDGFLLHHVADPRPDDEEQIQRALSALFIAYAMDSDETAEWERRLSAPIDPRRSPASGSAATGQAPPPTEARRTHTEHRPAQADRHQRVHERPSQGSEEDTMTDFDTMADLAARAAAQHGERVALRRRDGDAWRDITYTELGADVASLAGGLIGIGLEPGDRVCILAGTRPEWIAVALAVSATGAVVVPVYPTNSPEESRVGGGQLGGQGDRVRRPRAARQDQSGAERAAFAAARST